MAVKLFFNKYVLGSGSFRQWISGLQNVSKSIPQPSLINAAACRRISFPDCSSGSTKILCSTVSIIGDSAGFGTHYDVG